MSGHEMVKHGTGGRSYSAEPTVLAPAWKRAPPEGAGGALGRGEPALGDKAAGLSSDSHVCRVQVFHASSSDEFSSGVFPVQDIAQGVCHVLEGAIGVLKAHEIRGRCFVRNSSNTRLPGQAG